MKLSLFIIFTLLSGEIMQIDDKCLKSGKRCEATLIGIEDVKQQNDSTDWVEQMAAKAKDKQSFLQGYKACGSQF